MHKISLGREYGEQFLFSALAGGGVGRHTETCYVTTLAVVRLYNVRDTVVNVIMGRSRNDTIQILESVDVGRAIVASADNLLCGIPLVLMFIHLLKVAFIVRSRSSPDLRWD